MENMFLNVASLWILVLLFVMFFIRKEYRDKTTKLYYLLLVINILYCLFSMVSFIIARTVGFCFALGLIQKIRLIGIVGIMINLYVYEVNLLDFSSNTKWKIDVASVIIGIIVSLFIIVSPININIISEYNIITSGLAYDIMYSFVLIYLVLIIIYIARVYIKVKSETKKIWPFVVFVILYTLALAFRDYVSIMGICSNLFAFVMLIMYFTIENFDARKANNLEIEKITIEKANAAKNNFLAKVSHDVRTPLTAIVGLASEIDNIDNIDKVRDNSKEIVNASMEILDKVNGILDISKIEEDKMVIHNGEYSLVDECKGVIKYIEYKIDDEKVMFKYNFSKEIPKVLYGDKTIVKDIITNLLNHSIEYTKEGFIELNVTCDNKDKDSTLVITVSDSGSGISSEDKDKLFEKYTKFDDLDDDVWNASGLELSIVKKLVDLIGGKIVVKTGSGVGSKFTVTIDQKIAWHQKIEKPVEVNENTKADLTGKRILVVDDNSLNLKVAVNFIKEYGAIIETCTSGSECISLIKEGKKYDLIFMDEVMPKLLGSDTLRILRKDPNFKQPVIVLTALTLDGARDKYLDAGFDDYLAKPIIKKELERILIKYLNDNKQEVIFDEK